LTRATEDKEKVNDVRDEITSRPENGFDFIFCTFERRDLFGCVIAYVGPFFIVASLALSCSSQFELRRRFMTSENVGVRLTMQSIRR
jgi:hypothetical protein